MESVEISQTAKSLFPGVIREKNIVVEFSLACTVVLHEQKHSYITLGNKDFAVWDITTDSTLLGVTDT